MRHYLILFHPALDLLKRHSRPLLLFHLFFTLLSSTLAAPLVAAGIRALFGRLDGPVLSLSDLLDQLATPVGGGMVLLSLTLLVVVIYWQQAGMLLVVQTPARAPGRPSNRLGKASRALWHSALKVPSLSVLACLQLGTHLLLSIPLLALLTAFYGIWLGDVEGNLLTNARADEAVSFLLASLPFIALWVLLAAKLYLRWSLALALVTLDRSAPWAALSRSWTLTRHWQGSIAVGLLATLVIILLLPIGVSLVYDRLVTPLLWWLPEVHALLLPAMLIYLTAYLLITLAVTFAGIAFNAMLTASLYRRVRPGQCTTDTLAKVPVPATAWSLAWRLEIGVLLMALIQAWYLLDSAKLRQDMEVDVIAHRGSSLKAPENTLAAIDQAILEQADTIEIDVRLSADQEVMVFHDQGLSRLSNDSRAFNALTRRELETLDVGSWFGKGFADARIPGLDQVLERVRGKAGLMIDLKPLPGQEKALINEVFKALEQEHDARLDCWRGHPNPAVGYPDCGFPNPAKGSRLATTSMWLVEVIRTRQPDIGITLLAELILPGTLERGGFDVLGLRFNRVSDAEIALAQQYGYAVHAWTVNDRKRMAALLDRGVDGIITDAPGRLHTLLEERDRLSDASLMLLRLRHRLWR